jgi:UDPglucose 6-dehydrogenase
MFPRLEVAIVGLGYVGLVTAAGLATWGHRVRGNDSDGARIAALRAERLPFVEPDLERLLNGDEGSRFSVHEDMDAAVGSADIVMVAVGTHDGQGGWQTGTMEAALDAVVPRLRPGAVLAIRSTLPPAFVATLEDRIRALRPDGSIAVVLNPEFTREGTAVADFLHPERVVIGVLHDPDGHGIEAMRQLYAAVAAPVIEMSAIDACMTKLASNLFLATKISFANEIAGLCDLYGATVDRVVDAMGLDPRIGSSFLRPGVGFGGSCLPHQVTMMVRDTRADGQDTPLLAAVDQVNRGQRTRAVDLLREAIGGPLAGRCIALLGLTFKPGTDDLREAPALDIARALVAEGAQVVATDPLPDARERAARMVPGMQVRPTPSLALEGADAVLLVTEWPQYQKLDWRRLAGLMRGRVVIDGRNALDPAAVSAAGLDYRGFGRGLTEGSAAAATLASAPAHSDASTHTDVHEGATETRATPAPARTRAAARRNGRPQPEPAAAAAGPGQRAAAS